MTHKNGKGTNRDKPETCPLCGGSGRVNGERDDTDICAFDSKKAVCSLCRGSGRIKRHQRIVPTQRRCWLKKMPLKRPRSSRGGRPSLGKNILLQPGMPTADYVEDETEAISRRETDSTQQPSQFDIDSTDEVFTGQGNLSQELPQNETTDEIEIPIGDLSENLRPCNDQQEEQLQPEVDIPALLRRAAALGIDPFFPLAPDDYRKGVLSNISGLPGTLAGPNEQLESPPLNATTPGDLNQMDPSDVIGTPDPGVFPINTDVEGNIGS